MGGGVEPCVALCLDKGLVVVVVVVVVVVGMSCTCILRAGHYLYSRCECVFCFPMHYPNEAYFKMDVSEGHYTLLREPLRVHVEHRSITLWCCILCLFYASDICCGLANHAA